MLLVLLIAYGKSDHVTIVCIEDISLKLFAIYFLMDHTHHIKLNF